MARVGTKGLMALERRVRKELPKVVEAGCSNLAMERGAADLARENVNMPRQARLDADTIKQRERVPGASGSAPLIRTGQLRDSGVVRIREVKSGPNKGKIRYAIRREGNETSEASRASIESHGRRLAEESLLKSRMRTKSLRKTKMLAQYDRATGRVWTIRVLPREVLAGILRSGVKDRGIPPRNYAWHVQSWHDAISNKLIRKHLSDQLGRSSLRVLRSAGRFVVEVVHTAAEVA